MDLKEILVSKGLDEDKAVEVLSDMKENNIYLSSEENIDDRYGKLKQQKEDLDTQLQTANETINSLEKGNKSNEDLQTQIEDYKKQVETLKTESAATQKQAAIDLALVKNGAKNPKAVNALLDSEKVELTDEGIKGLDEQLEALKESDAYLFQAGEDDGNPQIQTGEDPNGDSGEESDAFEEVIISRYG